MANIPIGVNVGTAAGGDDGGGCDPFTYLKGNYSGMLIGLPIAILYFLARKITAEGAEERRAFNRLFPLCASLRTLRLNSLLVAVCSMSRIVPA